MSHLLRFVILRGINLLGRCKRVALSRQVATLLITPGDDKLMLKRATRRTKRLCTMAGLVPALLTGILAPAAAQTVSSSDRDIKHLDHLLKRADQKEDCVHVGDMRFKASALRAYRDS